MIKIWENIESPERFNSVDTDKTCRNAIFFTILNAAWSQYQAFLPGALNS